MKFLPPQLQPEQQQIEQPSFSTSSSTPEIPNVSKRKLSNSNFKLECNESILTRKKRKLLGSSTKHKETIEEEAHGNKIVDSKLLAAINACTKCAKCNKKGKFNLLQDNNRIQGEVLTLQCRNCDNKHCFDTSNRVHGRGGGKADDNTRSVYAAITGGGHTLLNTFTTSMNLPTPVSKTYS